ncbi:hypothetical protein ACINK0_01570 [Deinococcus sp. VB343]|uniref:Uncharacterized protein n=1 Tax=Deinococcus sp. VB142 TaxID=3112952 RepID=A0AAU6Q0X9_9DEIO
MKFWASSLLLALLLGVAGAAPSGQFSLRLSYGGALVQGQVRAGGDDAIVGVWSSVGRARLLRCQPRCQAVSALPVAPLLSLGSTSAYRVVLGGEFRAGQKVGLTMRFRSGTILNTYATVQR